MIYPRIGKETKALILFDVPQSTAWITQGRVTKDGIEKLLRDMIKVGIDLDDISVQCLSDYADGKAAGYKEKAEHIEELISTLAPNVIVLANSKAHEKFTGVKGASKFYNRVWTTDSKNQKLITIPPHSATVYNPLLLEVITNTLHLLKKEMEYSNIIKKNAAEKNYILVDTFDKFQQWYETFKSVDRYALDIETNSLQFNVGKILTVQFSEGPNKGWCIPTNDYYGKWSEQEWSKILAGMKEIIEDDTKERILANAYFDLKYLHYVYGFKLPKYNVTDVLLQSYLVDENRESHSLKYCAATLLEDAGDYERPLEEFKDAYCKQHKIKKVEFTYDLVPLDVLFQYSCMDVDYSYQLADYFKPLIEQEEQEQVYKDLIRYAWGLARIELTGWKVDLKEAERFKVELEENIEALHKELLELPEIKKAVKMLTIIALEKENAKRKTPITELKKPLEFLVGSVAHKRLLFRDVLKLPEIKKTKKGEYATDKECFAAWAEKYPDLKVINIIKDMEEHSKMLSTYVVGALFGKTVNGRISCNYRLTLVTGRTGSSNPNLQNISQHSKLAKSLKKCFVAEEGHTLVACDLSNAELRVTAAISKDPVMTESFIKGFDPHSSTAKAVFNLDCPVEEVKEKYPDKRQAGKTLNFASLYGAGANTIAKSIGSTEEEAQKMLDDYFLKHVGVDRMFKSNIMFAKEHGYVVYPNGRRRRVPHINSEDKGLKARAERQVNNSVIQGSSSDIALEALANMWEEIDTKNLPFKIINIIHDSIEMEVPEDQVEEAVEFITRNMSSWGSYLSAPFPMKCDPEVGKTWADLAEFEHHEFDEVLEDPEEEEE